MQESSTPGSFCHTFDNSRRSVNLGRVNIKRELTSITDKKDLIKILRLISSICHEDHEHNNVMIVMTHDTERLVESHLKVSEPSAGFMKLYRRHMSLWMKLKANQNDSMERNFMQGELLMLSLFAGASLLNVKTLHLTGIKKSVSLSFSAGASLFAYPIWHVKEGEILGCMSISYENSSLCHKIIPITQHPLEDHILDEHRETTKCMDQVLTLLLADFIEWLSKQSEQWPENEFFGSLRATTLYYFSSSPLFNSSDMSHGLKEEMNNMIKNRKVFDMSAHDWSQLFLNERGIYGRSYELLKSSVAKLPLNVNWTKLIKSTVHYLKGLSEQKCERTIESAFLIYPLDSNYHEDAGFLSSASQSEFQFDGIQQETRFDYSMPECHFIFLTYLACGVWKHENTFSVHTLLSAPQMEILDEIRSGGESLLPAGCDDVTLASDEVKRVEKSLQEKFNEFGMGKRNVAVALCKNAFIDQLATNGNLDEGDLREAAGSEMSYPASCMGAPSVQRRTAEPSEVDILEQAIQNAGIVGGEDDQQPPKGELRRPVPKGRQTVRQLYALHGTPLEKEPRTRVRKVVRTKRLEAEASARTKVDNRAEQVAHDNYDMSAPSTSSSVKRKKIERSLDSGKKFKQRTQEEHAPETQTKIKVSNTEHDDDISGNEMEHCLTSDNMQATNRSRQSDEEEYAPETCHPATTNVKDREHDDNISGNQMEHCFTSERMQATKRSRQSDEEEYAPKTPTVHATTTNEKDGENDQIIDGKDSSTSDNIKATKRSRPLDEEEYAPETPTRHPAATNVKDDDIIHGILYPSGIEDVAFDRNNLPTCLMTTPKKGGVLSPSGLLNYEANEMNTPNLKNQDVKPSPLDKSKTERAKRKLQLGNEDLGTRKQTQVNENTINPNVLQHLQKAAEGPLDDDQSILDSTFIIDKFFDSIPGPVAYTENGPTVCCEAPDGEQNNLAQQVVAAVKETNAVRTHFEGREKELNHKIDARTEELSAKIDEVKQHSDQMEEKNMLLKENKVKMQTRIENLEETLKKATHEVQVMTDEKHRFQQEVGQLRTDYDLSIHQQTDAQSQIKQQNDFIASLQQQVYILSTNEQQWTSQKGQYESKITELCDQNRSDKEMIEGLKKECHQNEKVISQLSQMEQEKLHLENVLSKAKEQVSEKREHILKLNETADLMSYGMEDANKELGQQSRISSHLKRDKEKLEQRLTELSGEMRERDTKISDLNEKIASMVQCTNDKDSLLSQKNKENERLLAETRKLSMQHTKMEENESKLEQLADQLKTKEAEIIRLAQIEENHATLEQKAHTDREQIYTLRQKAAKFSHERARLTDDVNERSDQIKELHNELERQNTQIAQLQSKPTVQGSSATDVLEQKRKISELESETNELRQKLTEALSTVGHLQSTHHIQQLTEALHERFGHFLASDTDMLQENKKSQQVDEEKLRNADARTAAVLVMKMLSRHFTCLMEKSDMSLNDRNTAVDTYCNDVEKSIQYYMEAIGSRSDNNILISTLRARALESEKQLTSLRQTLAEREQSYASVCNRLEETESELQVSKQDQRACRNMAIELEHKINTNYKKQKDHTSEMNRQNDNMKMELKQAEMDLSHQRKTINNLEEEMLEMEQKLIKKNNELLSIRRTRDQLQDDKTHLQQQLRTVSTAAGNKYLVSSDDESDDQGEDTDSTGGATDGGSTNKGEYILFT